MLLYTTPSTAFPYVRYMGHVTYSHPWMHFTRTADEFILYFIQSGSLYLQENGINYTLKEGDSFLLEPHLEHTGTKPSLCDYYFIHFRCEGLKRLVTTPPNLVSILQNWRQEATCSSLYLADIYENWVTSPLIFPKQWAPSSLGPFLSLLEKGNFTFYQQHENYRQMVSVLFHQLLLMLSKDYIDSLLQENDFVSHKSKARAQELKDYLDTHYAEKLTGESLAHHFEANYNYLNRIFKAFTGVTIMNYLNRLRIDHAKALIASSTHLTFADIGYLVGIDDAYYFSKLFKKYTGLTATAYTHSISHKEYK